jgi:hypothetical protein
MVHQDVVHQESRRKPWKEDHADVHKRLMVEDLKMLS